ncbi:hypothetical protein GUITHDRAFT_100706 [Guillardia theta CCMP2712]|uniref:Uncharacterized protein n=1 Tax=Guillardia theta (strain CCMP2712) TaxID=905079 RepID=L1K041_GUITC|nr:hypothetical protein GUITHDRAFT_100706 [Guillardia theta CCMP2712]EKX53738.1 hypothetical protein GUITHDRAFT_100706 [Guillardia theta CCMP2712]|eukprot:XP_005840718.1 hypothetical protein GUITHDRAFT_100706 [Guillardia theta CCMP2712]
MEGVEVDLPPLGQVGRATNVTVDQRHVRHQALVLLGPSIADSRNVDIAQRHRALSNDVREIPDEADGGRLDTGTRKSIIMRVFPRHVHARAASMQNPSLPNEAGLQSVIEHFSSQRTAPPEVLTRKRAATYQRLTMQLTLEALLSAPPEVLARKRAATYQRLTMQLTLEALLSGARRMTPLRAQALLEPEDSSSSDFVESPEESSPEVSDSDGGNPSSGPDDGRGAGDSEASPSLTVTSGASGELDTTGVLAAGPSSPASSPSIGRVTPVLGHCRGVAAVTGGYH